MSGVKDSLLADQTVSYNGVQFGGGDSNYRMMPPTYSLEGQYIYDEAGRAVTHTQYFLTVSTTVLHEDEAQQSAQMVNIRERLAKPGRVLSLKGLGLGFDENPEDLIWGVKPRSPRIVSAGGEIAHELSWTVEFNISECQPSTVKNVWMAMNFEQTWQYDFEGLCTRTIQGYYEIPQVRNPTRPDAITQAADHLRNNVQVAIPFGFRRLNGGFQEDKAKRRIDFSFVDEEFTDTPFPPGITQADGEFAIEANGVGLVSGSASLSMTLTTAPGVEKWRAGFVAMKIALARQAAMINSTKKVGEKSTVLPNRMRWSHRMWSRTSRFDFGWHIAGCAGDLLLNGGVWHPIPDSDWTQWFASVRDLYDNRGVSKLRSQTSEGAIIDICAKKNAGIIGGGTTFHAISQDGSKNFSSRCENIPEDGGWLLYDVDVRLARDEQKVIHRPAADVALKAVAGGASLPGESFNMPKADNYEVEQQGYPRQLVVLRWKGMRVHHLPQYPILKSFGGRQVTLMKIKSTDPKLWGCFAGCKVWFAQTAQLYEVLDGYVQSANDGDYKQDQTLCCT